MTAKRRGGDAKIRSRSLVAPAGETKVGGDFQVVDTVEHRTVAVIGDVAGNGPDAAPYADRACAELRKVVDRAEPVAVLEELNARIYGEPSFDRYVTARAIVIDPLEWSAQWAFAGHLPPHWLDTGMPLDGATPGLPLGVEMTCGAVSAKRRPLRPAEGFLLFTDGLEDVQGPGDDRFGSARITHTLARELNGASTDEVVSRIKQIVCEFGRGKLPDDLCLVAIRVE